MAQQTMYPAQTNSIQVELSSSISNSVTTIPISNAAGLPASPNLATIGMDETAETILYTGKSGNDLTGVTRGFQGAAKAWSAGTKVARYFSAYDHDTFKANIADHELRILSTENWFAGMARQALINGNFPIWQRGTSITNPANGSYLADRWKTQQNNGGGSFPNIVHSQVPFTAGDIIGVIPQAFYYYRVTPDAAGALAGSSYYQLVQAIENGTRYLCGSGKKVTVSFWARSGISGKKLGIDFIQHYGTGGSPSTQESIAGSTITLTSTWQKYTLTITTNTLVGKTFGSNNDDNLTLEFWYAWGSTLQSRVGASSSESFGGLGNIDIAQVQLCAGDVALPFQPRSFGEELALCQRYYEKSYNYTIAPLLSGQNSGLESFYVGTSVVNGTLYGKVRYKVKKRATTTVTIFPYTTPSNTGRVSDGGGTDQVASSGNVNFSGDDGFSVQNASGATLTPVSGAIAFHWTSDAEL